MQNGAGHVTIYIIVDHILYVQEIHMEIQVMKQRLDGSTRDVVSFSSVNFDEEFS